MSNYIKPAVSDANILRIFAFLLTPLACCNTYTFTQLPNVFLQNIFIYPVIIFCLWAWWKDLWTIRNVMQHYLWITLPLLMIIIMQILAIWPITDYNNLLLLMLKIGGQICSYIPIIIACQIIIEKQVTYKFLLFGFFEVYILILGVAALQFIFVLCNDIPQLYFLKKIFIEILTFFGNIELQWSHNGAQNVYAAGSYSLTTLRINSLFQESSVFASIFGVLFIPINFAFCFINCYKKYAYVFILFALFLSCFSFSMTGMSIFVIFTIFIIIFTLLYRNSLQLLGKLAIVVAVVLIFIFMPIGDHARYFFSRHAETGFTSPRLTITLAGIDLAMENPVFGVGRGNFSKYVIATPRYQKNKFTNQDYPKGHAFREELQKWERQGQVLYLSHFTLALAEYGFIIMALFVSVPIILWLKLYRLFRNNRARNDILFVFSGYSAWMVMAFTTSLAAMDPRHPAFLLPFLLTAMFVQNIRKNNAGTP